MIKSAQFSACGRYRYRLVRDWHSDSLFASTCKTTVFIGLNPSTANAQMDDPTIRRCVGFAKEWGCGRLVMVNLFALISTDPDALLTDPDPVGPDNNAVLDAELQPSGRRLVVCWGAFPQARERAAEVLRMFPNLPLRCLGWTADGSPKHPLYLPKGTELRLFGMLKWESTP